MASRLASKVASDFSNLPQKSPSVVAIEPPAFLCGDDLALALDDSAGLDDMPESLFTESVPNSKGAIACSQKGPAGWKGVRSLHLRFLENTNRQLVRPQLCATRFPPRISTHVMRNRHKPV